MIVIIILTYCWRTVFLGFALQQVVVGFAPHPDAPSHITPSRLIEHNNIVSAKNICVYVTLI